jgi:phosphohistidine phosphatase
MRELLVVRHAIALERSEGRERGLEDAQRPLTDEGSEKMEAAARGLVRLQSRCSHILSSPLLRAQQTATILQRHYPDAAMSQLEELAPSYSSEECIEAVNHCRERQIAIVGHEPGLSRLIAALIGCSMDGTIELKKGGVALLQFDHQIAPGRGILRWLVTPKQLRLLGKS